MAAKNAKTLALAGDPDADKLLTEDPLALLIGMVLDQQIPLEWAFHGPYELQQRLGGPLDATELADMDPDVLIKAFAEKPALHRYPSSMAKRVQELCRHIVDEYGADPAVVAVGARRDAGRCRHRRLPDAHPTGPGRVRPPGPTLGRSQTPTVGHVDGQSPARVGGHDRRRRHPGSDPARAGRRADQPHQTTAPADPFRADTGSVDAPPAERAGSGSPGRPPA